MQFETHPISPPNFTVPLKQNSGQNTEQGSMKIKPSNYKVCVGYEFNVGNMLGECHSAIKFPCC